MKKEYTLLEVEIVKESRRTVRKLSPLGQVRRDDAVDQMAVTQFLDVFLGKR